MEDQALARLRALSQNEHHKLAVVARQIIDDAVRRASGPAAATAADLGSEAWPEAKRSACLLGVDSWLTRLSPSPSVLRRGHRDQRLAEPTSAGLDQRPDPLLRASLWISPQPCFATSSISAAASNSTRTSFMPAWLPS